MAAIWLTLFLVAASAAGIWLYANSRTELLTAVGVVFAFGSALVYVALISH
jgi:hypothetical protein